MGVLPADTFLRERHFATVAKTASVVGHLLIRFSRPPRAVTLQTHMRHICGADVPDLRRGDTYVAQMSSAAQIPA
jgi:hypothetical protein